MNKPVQTSVASQALNLAALTHDVVIGSEAASGSGNARHQDIELLCVMLHAASAISQTVTVSHVGSESATNYLFILDTSALSSATNYVFRPAVAPVFKRGDTIRLVCANSGTPSITVYSKIQYRECA